MQGLPPDQEFKDGFKQNIWKIDKACKLRLRKLTRFS